ncbi:MAG: alpha/beta hydrolase [Actinobacteria bacterium]|nr:alpha/beta hydrolase [Actinomycetota bacterium]
MTDTDGGSSRERAASLLSPEAREIVEGAEEALGAPLDQMPVTEARERLAQLSALAPAGPEVHAIYDLGVPGPAGDVPVRIYVPREAERLPVLLWLHGGAWVLGDLEAADPSCRRLAVASDAIVVSVDYRLAPEHRFPAGLEDCYAALSWVAERIGEYGGDPSRVAVGGDSAGGNLAAALALMARDRSGPRIVFQLLVYPSVMLRMSSAEFGDAPVVNQAMAEYFWDLYVTSAADREHPYCAPLAADDLSGLPPAFVIVPEVDLTRADQERYADLLAAAGVEARSQLYRGVAHGFLDAAAVLEPGRQAVDDAAAALRQAFAT